MTEQEWCMMTCLGRIRLKLSSHMKYVTLIILLTFIICLGYFHLQQPSLEFEENRKTEDFHNRMMAAHDKVDGQNVSKSISRSDTDKFDLQIVHDAFKNALEDNGNISMDMYLKAYKELLRLINLLGKLFHFVSTDVQDKINIMDIYLHGKDSCHYQNISAMLEYEIEKEITVVKGHPPSASRTLLRLHRALLFLSEFLKHLAEMGPHDKLPSVLYKVYEDTLGPHHTWFVRKAFSMAVYAVPNRQHLLEKLCKRDCDDEELLVLLKQVPGVIQPVYDVTQELYEKHKVLDLP